MPLTFQIYSFASNELSKHEKSIINFLNKGYNVPRFKYNVITTPRIKHDLVTDLVITSPTESFAIFAFADNTNDSTPSIQVDNDPQVESAEITKSKLMKLYDSKIMNNYAIKYDKSLPSRNNSQKEEEALKFPINFANSCLGMICLKPHKSRKDYEITGFVSFFPKLGTLLCEISESFVMNYLSHVEQLWITAINEHNLRRMYESWGYVFQQTVLVPMNENGAVVDDNYLENDIGASQDFHLDILVKVV